MRTVSHKSLLQAVTFIVLIFSTHFAYSYASIEDENTINKIIETHGKNNVVNFILQERDGKITIQKKKSFLEVTGRPEISLVTAKSINHDLGILKIDINNLEAKLDIYIENETKKQQQKESSLSKSNSINANSEIPQSKKLKYQINKLESRYNLTDDSYERKRIKKELSKLERKYKEAKYNEKYNPGVNFSDTSSQKNSKYKRNTSSSYCNNYKSQLKKLTEPAYRHQIFFCNDRSYRAKNPKSCNSYKYSKQYTLQEYKDEVSRLRKKISSNCES